MAIVVEDGTGRADAESYVSVAEATAYHAARGNAAWAALASDTVREQLLRKAAEYMLQAYRTRWKQYRRNAVQGLDWPRIGVDIPSSPLAAFYPPDAVPTEVKRAQMDLALTASAQELNPTLGRETLREKIGDIEVDYNPSATVRVRYPSVDMALAPLLKAGGASVTLVRA